MYMLKLSKTEFETKGKAILEFMQSEEFRTRIQNSIAKSREAYEALKKEITTHFNVWNKRAKIYESIYRNTNIIQNTVQYVLLYFTAMSLKICLKQRSFHRSEHSRYLQKVSKMNRMNKMR